MKELFDRYNLYSENGNTVSLQEFQSFLAQEQNDPMGNDERKVSAFICDFLKVSCVSFLLYLNIIF